MRYVTGYYKVVIRRLDNDYEGSDIDITMSLLKGPRKIVKATAIRGILMSTTSIFEHMLKLEKGKTASVYVALPFEKTKNEGTINLKYHASKELGTMGDIVCSGKNVRDVLDTTIDSVLSHISYITNGIIEQIKNLREELEKSTPQEALHEEIE